MSNIKKRSFIVLLITASFLCSCQVKQDTPTPSLPQPQPSPSSGPADLPAETPIRFLDFSEEPPLDEYSASIAVPDFLTEEQQDLYRRAHCLYLNLFGVTTANVDRLGESQKKSGNETVVIDDRIYLISHGRYRNWEDFDALIHAVFTEQFWDKHNNLVSAAGEPWVLFREYNGSLCYLEIEKGQGYYYNENFPDEFRLESQSEDSILFTLIGHYSWVWPKEGESFEDRDARRAREYEYTIEFPIEMVLTENGWRLDTFYSTLVDER